MANTYERAFITRHESALSEYWDRIKRFLPDWKSSYQWPRGVTFRSAVARRSELERKIREELGSQGNLSKETFDSVLVWGFGASSSCSDAEIRQATRRAFESLASNEIAQAARELVKLFRAGISRASKILALSDQQGFGIYDSRSAHGLSDLKDNRGRFIAIPPGRVIAGDTRTKEEYCTAFEQYT